MCAGVFCTLMLAGRGSRHQSRLNRQHAVKCEALIAMASSAWLRHPHVPHLLPTCLLQASGIAGSAGGGSQRWCCWTMASTWSSLSS